jgi:hypothetical protein
MGNGAAWREEFIIRSLTEIRPTAASDLHALRSVLSRTAAKQLISLSPSTPLAVTYSQSLNPTAGLHPLGTFASLPPGLVPQPPRVSSQCPQLQSTNKNVNVPDGEPVYSGSLTSSIVSLVFV